MAFSTKGERVISERRGRGTWQPMFARVSMRGMLIRGYDMMHIEDMPRNSHGVPFDKAKTHDVRGFFSS